MKTALASVLTAASVVALLGCESNAEPTAWSRGYHVDAERQRSIWLTRDGVLIHSAAAPTRSIALPGWTYAGAPYCPPGVTVGPKGEVVVTSNVIPTLWRIDAENSAVTVHSLALDADQDKDVGFAALVYAAEQHAFIAYSDTQRSVWKVDASLAKGTKLAAVDLKRPRRACTELVRRLGDRMAP